MVSGLRSVIPGFAFRVLYGYCSSFQGCVQGSVRAFYVYGSKTGLCGLSSGIPGAEE